MGRQFPPLPFGSGLIGLACLACHRAFERGDLVRRVILHGHDRDEGRELDTAILHVTCPAPPTYNA